MERIAAGLAELVGQTPLMELHGYARHVEAPARIVAKMECFNPAGSAKDRIGVAMIEDAAVSYTQLDVYKRQQPGDRL